MNYWPLLGIALVVIGFALRFNPLLVVVGAAVATGLLAGLDIVAVVEALGRAFNDNRYISVTWIILPVIGLLERYGLQQRARSLIESVRGATMGKLLVLYLLFRQLTAALGMKDIGGHPQAVRPLVAPMAEAAATKSHGVLPEAERQKVLAMSAASRCASASSSPGATTRLTSPQRSAVSASRKLPVKLSSFARLIPIIRLNFCDRPQPGTMPTRACVSAKRALLLAISTSQASATSNPPVIATPLIATLRVAWRLSPMATAILPSRG